MTSNAAPTQAPQAPEKGATPEDSSAPKSLHDRILIALAIVAFIVTGYFLMVGLPSRLFAHLEAIGSIESEGNVRRRHAGSLSWETMHGTQKIYLRDIIYVPKDVKAQVNLGKRNFAIPSDTMVQFDESSVDQFEITLLELKGAVVPLALPAHRANLSNLLAEITPYELRLSELKSRTFSAIYEGPTLAKAFPMARHDFSLDKISDYEIRLIYPQPDRFNLRANRWMKMSWSPVPLPGVAYTLEVSKDSRFRKMLPHQTKTNRLLVQFDDEATFYWRVRGAKDDDETISEALSFTMVLRGGKTPTLPTIRTLDGPKGGGK